MKRRAELTRSWSKLPDLGPTLRDIASLGQTRQSWTQAPGQSWKMILSQFRGTLRQCLRSRPCGTMKAGGQGELDALGRQPAGQSSLGPKLRDLTVPEQEWAATLQQLPLRRRIGKLDRAFQPLCSQERARQVRSQERARQAIFVRFGAEPGACPATRPSALLTT